MKWAAGALTPVGVVVVVHALCKRLGMSEGDALVASFLVWTSCASALLLILAAIDGARRSPRLGHY